MTERNKQKNILRRQFATGFFVLLTITSFLFSENAWAIGGDYNKAINGTLGAGDWNNLVNDFVAKSGSRLDGNFSINTATSSFAFDVNGLAQFSQPVIVGTPTLNGHAATKSYVDSSIGGGSGSTVGYWTMNGTNINNSNAGNVGIGTTNPNPTGASGTFLNVSSSGSNVGGVTVGGSGSAEQLYLYADTTNNYGAIQAKRFGVGFDNLVLQAGGGNVGIGVTNPGAKFVVNGNAMVGATWGRSNLGLSVVSSYDNSAQTFPGDADRTLHLENPNATVGAFSSLSMRVDNTGSGSSYNIIYKKTGASAGTAIHSIQSSQIMALTSGGNVGIGTTTPNYKLEVNGTASFNQPVIVGTPTIASHATTKSYVDSLIGSAIATGTPGQTLRHNGISWVANSILFNNGTNVGIGTTNPTQMLHLSRNQDGEAKLQIDNANTGVSARSGFEFTNNISNAYFTLYGSNYSTASLRNNVYLANNAGGFVIRANTGSSINFGIGANAGDANDLTIDPSGNVGVGTTTPTYKFEVNGNALFNQPVIVGTPTINSHAATKSYVDSSVAGGSGSTVGYWVMNGTNISNINSGNVGIGTTTLAAKLSIQGNGSDLINLFDNTATERFTILNNGNVGIGTTTPGSRLDIQDNITSPITGLANAATIRIRNSNWAEGTTGTGFIEHVNDSLLLGETRINNGHIGFYTNNGVSLGERLTIISSGNIGIGSTTPTYKFEVNGTGLFNQPVIVGTPTINSHAATKSYVDSLVGSSISAGTSGQTLRHNGTSWIANSLLFNDGTNIGIGTTTLAAKLAIQGSGSDLVNIFDNTAAERFTILNSGNVGVGTAAPNQLLVVAGATPTIKISDITATRQPQLELVRGTIDTFGADGYTDWRMYIAGGDLRFFRQDNGGNNGDAITFGALGNLGIGSTTPTYKLEVNGTGLFNQPVIVGTPTGATHAATKSYVDSLVGSGIGAGTSGQTLRHNGTSWIANSLLFNDGTNIGIGTTSPASKLQVIGGSISSPDSGTNSERFGLNSQADGTYANAFGNNANVTGSYSSAFGTDVSVTGNYSTAFGSQTTLHGDDSLVLGEASTVGATPHDISRSIAMGTDNYIYNSNVVALGGAISTTHPNTFLVGTGVFSTAANQVVIGANGFPKTDIFFGNGVTNASPSAYTIHGTSGSGADVPGANLQLAAGQGTGTGIGGSILFQTADAGLTGSSLNPLVTRFIINNTGNIGIGTTTPNYKLDVNGTGAFNQPVIVGTPTGATHATTKSYVDSLVGSGIGAGTSGQTLRHNGTSWVANSILFNNGTNIGIGTTTPIAKLDIPDTGVSGDTLLRAGNSSYFFRVTNGQYPRTEINANGSVMPLTVRQTSASGSGTLSLGNASANSHITTYSANENLRIQPNGTGNILLSYNSGNVGIGTSTPTYKLEVNGTALFNQPVIVGTPTINSHAATKSYVDSLIAGGSGSTVGYWTMSGTNISNSNAGNVGIGTTTPLFKVDINGTFRATASSSSFTLDSNGDIGIGI